MLCGLAAACFAPGESSTDVSMEELAALVEKYSADLCAATLCDQLAVTEPAGYTKAWDINGEAVTLGVEKL